MIEPIKTTIKPAPDDKRISVTVMVKSFGLPRIFGLSVNEYWVLAIQIGKLAKLFLFKRFIFSKALALIITSFA